MGNGGIRRDLGNGVDEEGGEGDGTVSGIGTVWGGNEISREKGRESKNLCR